MRYYFSIALLVLGLCTGTNGFAQVGMMGNTPDKSAILDLRYATKQGLLIQDVSLVALNDPAPISSTPAVSLLVFNTNAALGTGFYYWDGAMWNKLATLNDLNVADNLGNHRATGDLHMTNHNIDSISTANILNDLKFNDTISANTNYIDIYKKDGRFGIWNSNKNAEALFATENNNYVGIGGTANPTNPLTVTGNDPLKLAGLSTSTNDKDSVLVAAADGVVKRGNLLPLIYPGDAGTVMAIGGRLVLAQEISLLMTADDVHSPTTNTPTAIRNLTNEIIDNRGRYTGTASGNSFTVEETGVYQTTMNVCISILSPIHVFPIIGVWCDTDNKWVTKMTSEYLSNVANPSMGSRHVQTYTLISSDVFEVGKTYSFRVSSPSDYRIWFVSQGYTGSGPVTFCSLKRLK